MAETISSADYIFQQSKLQACQGSISLLHSLGQGLKTIASLILSDINTQGILYFSRIVRYARVMQNNQQKEPFHGPE